MHGQCQVNGLESLHSLSRSMQNGRVTEMVAIYDGLCRADPALPDLGAPYIQARSLSPMSVFPADFPILCLPGDKLFQSKELDKGYSLPPMVHAFHGSKVGLGHQLQQWQSKGLQPLAVSLIGVDEAPPLWTHPTGCDFGRGSKIVAKPQVSQRRSLTKTQVLLLQSLWTPVEVPNCNNDHTPWPKTCQTACVFCGQQARLAC